MVLPLLRIELRSEEEEESDETGFVAEVLDDARRDKTRGLVTFAGDCKALDWGS